MYKHLAKTVFVGKSVIYLPTCHSTNQIAEELLTKPDIASGTIVITDNQTSGRGQRGNTWQADPGSNLTFTVISTPEFLPISRQFDLNIVASLAVRATVTEFVPDVHVKWPNDVLVGTGKIAGILIQNFITGSKIRHTLIGIGLNVNQVQFDLPQATSLAAL